MAEALFGVINPGAKLPLTVVRDEGQIPSFYNHKPSARRGYLFADKQALFPFGHGLSYTQFDIGQPRLARARVKRGDVAGVQVEIRNVGKRSGDEVVQLYVHDQIASVTRPVKLLKAFQRVTLAAGERRTLQFELGPDAFSFWNDEMQEVVEAGMVDIMVGPNSVDLKTATVEIV
jgi:beta-glucosidase